MKFWTGYFRLHYPETLCPYSEFKVVMKTTWDIFEATSLFILTHLKLYGTWSKLIFLFCLRYQIINWSDQYYMEQTQILFKLLFCNLDGFTWVDKDSGIEVVSYTWSTIILSRATQEILKHHLQDILVVIHLIHKGLGHPQDYFFSSALISLNNEIRFLN